MKMQLTRKLYSPVEAYWITYNLFRSVPDLRKARKNGEMDRQFMERIMLAVTEVNGCAICSYAHTKMALETGMSNEEIQNMLAGMLTDVPADELEAILFAQHYADSRAKPSKEAWARLVEVYGETKAGGILGAIRIIMWGNAYGIPWSSFSGRFKGKPDERSTLPYELTMFITVVFYLPIAGFHALLLGLFKKEK